MRFAGRPGNAISGFRGLECFIINKNWAHKVRTMDRTSRLFNLANELALSIPNFFETKGPGKGNHSTNDFIKELRNRAITEFGEDFSEKNICGDNSLAVDFYFPDEGAIVEIALGLKNPSTEYEKDILKAVMAKSLEPKVSSLIFVSKPGGNKKCKQPGRQAVREWLECSHGIKIEVVDLGQAKA